MMLFTVLIAAFPLLVSGQTLIRIAEDELKSSANEQLVSSAKQVAQEIDLFYEYSLYAPLDLIRNAIDGDTLGVEEKIALLKQGISDLPDVVALQVSIENARVPMIVSQQAYTRRLRENNLEPLAILRVDGALPVDADLGRAESLQRIDYVEQTGDWLATAVLPLQQGLMGRRAVLYARINMTRLQMSIADHAFAKTGTITIVDADGMSVLGAERSDLGGLEMVRQATSMLQSQSRTISVRPYRRPDDTISLGAISFPRAFRLAVLTEKAEKDAYLPITMMARSLRSWIIIGLGIGAVGAVIFALGLSRPILAIGEVAGAVAGGDLDARVRGVTSRDEIGDLAGRFNDMIGQLSERFELLKFVSDGTVAAIQESENGVKLGGERRQVAILFADIRGYTAFSEGRDPETVVAVLNHYFQVQAEIVARNRGDIDKFVGDQIMAVFLGDDMAQNAVRCALQIQQAMTEQKAADTGNANLDIGIGIDMGGVVMGAMGSRKRMDYTVLGDHVNLAARLCSAAEPGQTLISKATFDGLTGTDDFRATELRPIRVKGKKDEIAVFAVDLREAAEIEPS